jgi:hypothetical protein
MLAEQRRCIGLTNKDAEALDQTRDGRPPSPSRSRSGFSHVLMKTLPNVPSSPSSPHPLRYWIGQ